MSGKKRVLLLGSGYVSATVIEYLTRDSTTQVTVASVMKDQLEHLASKYRNTIPLVLNVATQQDRLSSLVKDHDLVISLLPYSFHPEVAKICIKNKVNLVTSSYLSPAMKEFGKSAEEAGITIVNEVGLDPGIDHMIAMDAIDQAKADGATVESYVSLCGGLPAPECSDNPLRYKFSWSPYTALLNTVAPATFLKDGEIINIPPGGALLDAVTPLEFLPGFNLEAIPNRDSTTYALPYGIQSAHTLFRGTIRFKGYATAISGFVKLGMINSNPCPMLHPGASPVTWRELLCHLVEISPSSSKDELKNTVYNKLERNDCMMQTLEWFDMFNDEAVPTADSILSALVKHLEAKLSYESEERDMIILRNDVGVRHLNGELETKHTSLVVYGDPKGYSAMAKTVGYPTAILAKMVLDEELQTKGLVLPLTKDIYGPVLNELKAEGLKFDMKSTFSK